jgi:AcrR family transcriptional regulator
MTKKNLGLRERKKLQTRKNIIKYSTRLFEKNGYDNTAIGDICDKCEISKATFFNYFETKDQLLSEILADDLEAMLDNIDREKELNDRFDIKDIINIICTQAIESITKYPYVSSLVYSKLLIDVESHTIHNKFRDVMLDSISESQRGGLIDRELNPLDVYATLEGLILGMLISNSDVDKETKVSDGVKIILRGLGYTR